MKVSAIVIFLNARRFLAEAVESVLAQTLAVDELLLVDDGSTDGSGDVAGELARDERVRVLRHPGRANRGMSASRNLALGEARGDAVAFLDADDRWPREKLAVLVPVLESDPSLAAVFGAVRFFGDAELVVEPPLGRLEPERLLRETLLGRRQLLTTLGNPVLRRSALVEVGGLEDEFAGQSEDAVAWCKLALRFPFAAVADTALEYRRHPGASGAVEAARLAAGDARFARWLHAYVVGRPERGWAEPIVAEYLFRRVVLEAWLTPPEDPVRRRARLVSAARRLGPLTARRRLRLAAQLVGGLRSGALTALQEPECRA